MLLQPRVLGLTHSYGVAHVDIGEKHSIAHRHTTSLAGDRNAPTFAHLVSLVLHAHMSCLEVCHMLHVCSSARNRMHLRAWGGVGPCSTLHYTLLTRIAWGVLDVVRSSTATMRVGVSG